MAEWFKAAVLKTVGGNPRRFESCSLRRRFPKRITTAPAFGLSPTTRLAIRPVLG